MARKTADPRENIKLWRARLGETEAGQVANGTDMARIAGMTRQNFIENYVRPDEQFPILKRGREGTGYEFRVADALAHLIRRAEERLAASDARARQVTALIGVEVPDDENPLSLAEIKTQIEAMNALQRMKREQGHFVTAERHREVVRALATAVQLGIFGLPAKLDPTGQLPPEVRSKIDDAMSDLAVRIQELAENELGADAFIARADDARTGNRL